MCENLNRQIKRRRRLAGLFPNEKSVLKTFTDKNLRGRQRIY